MSSYSDRARLRSDLILQKGRAQAEGAARSGQIWVNTLQNLGQLAAGIPGQMAEGRQMALQEKRINQQGQLIDMQLQGAQSAQQLNEQVNQIMESSLVEGQDGVKTFDRDRLRQGFLQANIPLEQQDQVFKSLDGIDASLQTFRTGQIDALADIANGVLEGGATSESLALGLAIGKANGLFDDTAAEPFLKAITEGGDIAAILKQVRGLSGKYKAPSSSPVQVKTLENGQEVTKFVNPEAGASYPVPPSVLTPDQTADNTRMDAAAAEAARHNKAMEGRQTAAGRMWVYRDGKPVRVSEGDIQPGDKPAADVTADGGVKLSAGQQEDLGTMLTVATLAQEVQTIGDEIDWKGVGAVWSGSRSEFWANLGWGSDKEQELRSKLGNIQATIAKMRGGTSFTPNEQKLLDQYTPTKNDGDQRIKSKLKSLGEFIETKRKLTLRVAGGDYSGVPDAMPNAAPTTPAVKVGDIRLFQGKRYKVVGITNGQADLELVQ